MNLCREFRTKLVTLKKKCSLKILFGKKSKNFHKQLKKMVPFCDILLRNKSSLTCIKPFIDVLSTTGTQMYNWNKRNKMTGFK